MRVVRDVVVERIVLVDLPLHRNDDPKNNEASNNVSCRFHLNTGIASFVKSEKHREESGCGAKNTRDQYFGVI